MNIDIFSEYEVNYKNEYSYVSDYEFNEPIYSDDIHKFNKTMNGDELLDLISKELSDKENITVVVKGKTISIYRFNKHEGTDANIIIKIKRIEENKESE